MANATSSLVTISRYTHKPYSWKKIGKIIGWGGEHIIFTYEKDKVIKFSWHVSFSGKHGVRKLVDDYRTGEQYMGAYLLPIEIRTWHQGKAAVEIQPKIRCRPIRKSDLNIPSVRQQLKDILKQNDAMIRELGYGCDLFGFKGLFGRLSHFEISNILVTDGDVLRMVDFTTLTIVPRWYEWPLAIFIRWAQKRQANLLKAYWNLDSV